MFTCEERAYMLDSQNCKVQKADSVEAVQKWVSEDLSNFHQIVLASGYDVCLGKDQTLKTKLENQLAKYCM